MSLFRYRRYAIVRRLLVVASLGGFLATTVGVPIAVRVLTTGKDRSQPFPCQHHRCGCASAEQCWRSCCCFTNSQKLVWAAEHGVKPPEYVFAAAVREKPVSLVRSCCQLQTKSCCAHGGSCCDETGQAVHDGPSEAEKTEEAVADGSWSIEFVSAIQARRCQGHAELWLALGAVTVPPAKIELNLERTECGMVAVLADSLAGISLCPAVPPPRV